MSELPTLLLLIAWLAGGSGGICAVLQKTTWARDDFVRHFFCMGHFGLLVALGIWCWQGDDPTNYGLAILLAGAAGIGGFPALEWGLAFLKSALQVFVKHHVTDNTNERHEDGQRRDEKR